MTTPTQALKNRLKSKKAYDKKKLLAAQANRRCTNCGEKVGKWAEEVAPGFWVCRAHSASLAATQFEEGNIAGLESGIVANPDRLPAQYQTRFPIETTTQAVLLSTLEDMTDGALTMLGWLEQCDHIDASEVVGAYQQLTKRLVKLRGEMRGGKQKPSPFGDLDDEYALKLQGDLSRALGHGLTKFKHTYAWVVDNGLVDDLHHFRGYTVKGLASILAGSGTIIEQWSQLRQWEDKKRNQPSDEVLGAYVKRTRR